LQQNGVDLRQNSGVLQLRLQNGLAEARAGDQSVAAREVIVAAGPWSTDLLQPLGFDIGVEPFRGQMAMWQLDSQAIAHVINEGPRYVLCRPDGELIVGSTVEEVGFDCRTTDEGIAALVEFAQRLIPRLRGRPPDTTWAGLRPHSRDGVPSIGRVAAIDNLTVATGHFRSGIHLAPATALLVRQVLCNEPIAINIAPFAPRRN
jgi:glycine oxidase